ncbi:MAG: DUF1289 domain-containing protein [Gammaproteobacteria bacterium]|nr:DUF1289 domain-containing protein [Gammaproteobacteria bacterium]
MTDKPRYVPTPCVMVCTLDANDVCLGCYRTADEIGEWVDADAARRDAILEAADTRMLQAGREA